ncbi:MAG: hypothetical protein KDE20_16415, partial [Caldilineaceae bacterium]|nr:hypothetical protein [Caldilineaceae bacterium]
TSGFQGVLSDRAVRRTLKHAILGEKLLRKLPILEFADKEAATRYHHEMRGSINAWSLWPAPARTWAIFNSKEASYRAATHILYQQRGLFAGLPYTNLSVVRFALSVPAFLWSAPFDRKKLLRDAQRQRLPPTWTERGRVGALSPLFERAWAHESRTAVKLASDYPQKLVTSAELTESSVRVKLVRAAHLALWRRRVKEFPSE